VLFFERWKACRQDLQTNGLWLPRNALDARSVPACSIPADKAVNIPDEVDDESLRTCPGILPCASELDLHRARSYNLSTVCKRA